MLNKWQQIEPGCDTNASGGLTPGCVCLLQITAPFQKTHFSQFPVQTTWSVLYLCSFETISETFFFFILLDLI